MYNTHEHTNLVACDSAELSLHQRVHSVSLTSKKAICLPMHWYLNPLPIVRNLCHVTYVHTYALWWASHHFCNNPTIVISNLVIVYKAQHPVLTISYNLLPARHVQPTTILMPLGNIQLWCNYCARIIHRQTVTTTQGQSVTQVSELEHCRVNKLAQGFMWQPND